ncbi:MAG: four helix bundle protein, partial [Verrucomicrobiota bacterium]
MALHRRSPTPACPPPQHTNSRLPISLQSCKEDSSERTCRQSGKAISSNFGSHLAIVLNLAEGNGKFTSPDRCRFFDISRGSALECAAALDVLVPRGGTGVSWVWSPPGKSGYAELFRC